MTTEQTTTAATVGAADKPALAFLGLGYMGSRMAKRLLDAGYSVTVYNRDRAKTGPLAAAGARVAATPSEAASGADITISMLANDAAVRSVILGVDGVLASAKSGSILVEMSTVGPDLARDISEVGKTRGIDVLDAPVSGSTPQAEAGQLIVFAGGDAAVVETCKPVFEVISKIVHHMGASGSGATMKLVNNSLLGVGLQALAEAICLGQKAGIDASLLLGVLGQTTVVAPALMGKLKNAQTDEYAPAFPIRLMHKDFGLALGLASQLQVPMPTTAVAQQLCAAELAKGDEEDFSATIKVMREISRV